MSNLVLGQISALSPTTNLITVAPGDTVYSPGSVVQVVQTYLTAVSTASIQANYTTGTDVPDLRATITPKSASSKIYIMVRWVGEYGTTGQLWESMWGIKRGSTVLGRDPSWSLDRSTGIAPAVLSYYASDANSTLESAYFDYLDSPGTTGAITYQVYITSTTGFTLTTNRTVAAGTTSFEHGSSSVTLWEIAQ